MNRSPRLSLARALGLRALTLFALTSVAVAPARAENLLANGEFDLPDGLSGWQVSLGALDLVADSGGCPSSDALAGSSAAGGGGIQFLTVVSSQCIAVDGAVESEIHLGAMYRTSAAVWARLDLRLHASADCSDAVTFAAPQFGSTSVGWNRIAGTVALPANTRSVRVQFGANPHSAGEPPFTVEWDRLYVGFEPEILVDGFELEGGSTCRWSSATGAD